MHISDFVKAGPAIVETIPSFYYLGIICYEISLYMELAVSMHMATGMFFKILVSVALI